MQTNPHPVTYHTSKVGGVHIFYREGGDPRAPTVLLLHGFPSSSHMFRNLIPQLTGSHHVIAPDLPGFGFSSAPDHGDFAYTFEHLAEVMAEFVEQMGLSKFAIYVFDYGAPVGFRLALRFPDRITAVITQNGNAYMEGISEDWAPLHAYWANPTPVNRFVLRRLSTPEITRWQYFHGVTEPELHVAPEALLVDQALLDRPQSAEIQLDLIADYRTNFELYPKFHQFFRTYRPPTLAVWGRHDPFFLPAGAEAFRRDNPAAKVVFFETGHFALETHGDEIAQEILKFLADLPRP